MSVTIVIGKRQLLAAVSLLVLTALIGVALVVPAVSDATTTYYTRSVSCSAADFQPTVSGGQYASAGQGYVYSTSYGETLACNPALPSGAIVTKLQGTARLTQVDAADAMGVGSCFMERTGLTVASHSVQLMATVNFDTQSTAGVYRMATTSISNATIDNTQFAYDIECNFDGLGADAGLYGVDVIYKITAAKG